MRPAMVLRMETRGPRHVGVGVVSVAIDDNELLARGEGEILCRTPPLDVWVLKAGRQ